MPLGQGTTSEPTRMSPRSRWDPPRPRRTGRKGPGRRDSRLGSRLGGSPAQFVRGSRGSHRYDGRPRRRLRQPSCRGAGRGAVRSRHRGHDPPQDSLRLDVPIRPRGSGASPDGPPIRGCSARDRADVRVATSEASASESTHGGSTWEAFTRGNDREVAGLPRQGGGPSSASSCRVTWSPSSRSLRRRVSRAIPRRRAA